MEKFSKHHIVPNVKACQGHFKNNKAPSQQSWGQVECCSWNAVVITVLHHTNVHDKHLLYWYTVSAVTNFY